MSLKRLQQIVADLRDPESGCPWDQRQDFKSIAAYTLEEAYEVIDAIDREDFDELKDELGDLLLQVVFHAQMAAEKELFDLTVVIEAICDKMWRRHPHVFEKQDARKREKERVDEHSVKRFWEAEKAREREDKDKPGVLAGVAKALPALKRAQKLQKRAARVGFDWPNTNGVYAKIHEELAEIQQAGSGENIARVQEELGDLLFACVNLARHLGVDAESGLLEANRKFEQRFHAVEVYLQAQNKQVEDCNLQELDAIWDKVKRAENVKSS